MARLEQAGWTIDAQQAELLAPALELARTMSRDLAGTSGAAELAGIACWYKHDRWRWKTRLRYALKRLWLQPYPRRAERRNLAWLRERCFLAAEPLVVGEHRAAGLVDYGFLVTRRVEAALRFDEFCARHDSEQRQGVIEELAREVARMHVLRFVHRDLFARNILVRQDSIHGRIVFLDCWAGGAGPGWRGRAHDLACLDSDLRQLLSDEERADFSRWYEDEARAQRR